MCTKSPSTTYYEYVPCSLLTVYLPYVWQPFGKISDITNPIPVPAGVLRSSTVTFSRIGAATRAHNCIHGFTLVDEPAVAGSTTGGKPTRLATLYEKPIRAHAVRDWISGHPRIVIPVLVFLLGALSYTVRSLLSPLLDYALTPP